MLSSRLKEFCIEEDFIEAENRIQEAGNGRTNFTQNGRLRLTTLILTFADNTSSIAISSRLTNLVVVSVLLPNWKSEKILVEHSFEKLVQRLLRPIV